MSLDIQAPASMRMSWTKPTSPWSISWPSKLESKVEKRYRLSTVPGIKESAFIKTRFYRPTLRDFVIKKRKKFVFYTSKRFFVYVPVVKLY